MKTFEQLHKEGAERFPAEWLMINSAIADTADIFGYERSKHKLLLSAIALKVLNVMKYNQE